MLLSSKAERKELLEENFNYAASNAITIINSLKMKLSGLDLSYVKIPKAILRNANLSNSKLKGSDLRQIDICHAQLGKVNL